eukprot:scaffold154_cov76-Skeletonema_marinoi.AAC.2
MNRLLDGNDADDVDNTIEDSSVDIGEEVTVPRNMSYGSKNITSSSFDEALENLSQEIMKTIQSNQTTSGGKEKNSWFRF